MRMTTATLAAFGLAASATLAQAIALPPPGVAACSGCHGSSGLQNPAAAALPPLAGRNAADIEAAMRAFRDGTRPATVMGRIAKGFSDAEIAAIAAWYAAQR